MGTFKIDGRDIPFEPGDSIIRAAWRHGIEIPHYCWHPGLSVAANCRMCLVEIKTGRPMAMPILRWDDAKKDYVQDTKPKLQPACQMAVSDGLEVATQSAEVQKAQAAVQEFLLLNHPVDCPICDQAGECKLQDYWLEHQSRLKRKETEPVHKPKGVRFGPTIVYDAERCVMCTRCIRFCDEVAKDHVLDMRERGNKNEIVLAQGRELDHRYTLMTEHVCPVGALTSRDFRFKARVWFLKSSPTVCAGCATGCNAHADFDPRYNAVCRLRPRDNLDVNQYWMCDDGMMSYHRIHEGRVKVASRGRGASAEEEPVSVIVSDAARALASVPGARIAFVLSAQHPSEDDLVLAKLAAAVGSDRLYLAALPPWQGDDILRSADQNPNRAGALAAGGGRLRSTAELLADVRAGDVSAVVALGAACEETVGELAPLAEVPVVVSLTSHVGGIERHATHVVPVAYYAEMQGTFVNAKGIAQVFKRVIPPPPGVRPAWQTLVDLAQQLGARLDFAALADVRAALGHAAPAQAAPTMETRA